MEEPLTPSELSRKNRNSKSKADEFLKSEGEQASTNLRGEARAVGTPDYMAPEMLKGKGLDQPTIDYWAVGVIFFELIAGIPPFNASTVEEVFENIRNIRIPWNDLVDEEGEEVISPEAKKLILDLLTANPEQRLGAQGVDEIKNHIFFAGILKLLSGFDWSAVRTMKPPFVPEVKDLTAPTTMTMDKMPLPLKTATKGSTAYQDPKTLNSLVDVHHKSDIVFMRKDILMMENSKASTTKKEGILKAKNRKFSILAI